MCFFNLCMKIFHLNFCFNLYIMRGCVTFLYIPKYHNRPNRDTTDARRVILNKWKATMSSINAGFSHYT